MTGLKEKLEKKVENGKEYFFYPGLGWIDEKRLSCQDVQKAEAYKRFMCNPENSHNCECCPENRGDTRLLPCGQQNCWVDCHCRNSEEEERI